MARFTPYGVVIDADGAGAGVGTTIGGVISQDIDTGTTVNAEVTSGAEGPQYGELSQIQPGGNFTTHDLATLWALLGSRGLCITGVTNAGFGLYKLKREPCGALTDGSVHSQTVIPNGLIVPRTISVQQGQRASMTAEVFSLFDGTNLPIQYKEAVAAPTGLADAFGFHIGLVTLADIAIPNVTGIEIDFGVTVVPQFDDGESYAKSLVVTERKPTITITTHAMDKRGIAGTQIPLTGRAATHANSSIVLRRRINGTGAFSTTTDSIRFTVAGVVNFGRDSASQNNPWETQLMVTALDDTTNDLFVPAFNYAQA